MLSIKQQHENLKNILQEAIETVKNEISSDADYYDFAEKLACHLENLSYEFSYDTENEGDWQQEGKCQYLEGQVEKFTINGLEFYVDISSSRSGSYHTDWYYSDLDIGELVSKEEYFAPKPIFSQETKEFVFNFYDDKTVSVSIKESGEKLKFANFDFALKHIKKQ